MNLIFFLFLMIFYLRSDLKSPKIRLNAFCMIPLQNRIVSETNGTLMISLTNGRIQVWSHHRETTSYITDFNAIHVADDVSKWLIDVHFALLILMYSFCFCSSVLFIFMLAVDKKQNNFIFQQCHFFARCSLCVSPQNPTIKNVSHSNDNRHSKLLFIHGLCDGTYKSMDDCQLLVCFQLYVMISTRTLSLPVMRNNFFQIHDKSFQLFQHFHIFSYLMIFFDQ
jgi:hypothetical protein